ncbi:MAG: WhiB family transcriptional regulator [Acidimicrobiales bacterium]
MPEDFTLPDGFTLPADTTSSAPRRHSPPGDVGTCPDVSILGERPSWQRKAACRGKAVRPGANWWFPTSREAEDAARAVCEPCPVRRPCLEYALSDPGLQGVWAGTDERERRRMRQASA